MLSVSELYIVRPPHSPQDRLDDAVNGEACDPSRWTDLPAEVLHLISRQLTSADCWTVRSVATGWAAAVRSRSDIQLVIRSELPKIKSKFALARTFQSRYPHVEFVVRVIPPLCPLECIKLLRVLKYQANHKCVCKTAAAAGGQRPA